MQLGDAALDRQRQRADVEECRGEGVHVETRRLGWGGAEPGCRMSWHRSTHSLQMNGPGPAISFETSSCDLPQKLQ
jgi:hypothetical protein